MGRLDYRRCRLCLRPRSEVGELSHERLCVNCGDERRESNNRQLNAHAGPWFDHWRRRSAAAVGAVLLDDVLPPA